MIINHKKKWIYIGPPKTGSTAISYVLTDMQYNPNKSKTIVNKCFGGISDGGQHTPWPPEHIDSAYSEYFVFLSVRNPYSRIVSLWNHWRFGKNFEVCANTGNLTLNVFLKQVINSELNNDGFFSKTLCEWVPKFNSFIKQENIYKNLKNLNLHSNDFKIPEINPTKKSLPGWKDAHTDETVKLTQIWAESDFDTFKYSRDLNA